jgi:hypothetical protein
MIQDSYIEHYNAILLEEVSKIYDKLKKDLAAPIVSIGKSLSASNYHLQRSVARVNSDRKNRDTVMMITIFMTIKFRPRVYEIDNKRSNKVSGY